VSIHVPVICDNDIRVNKFQYNATKVFKIPTRTTGDRYRNIISNLFRMFFIYLWRISFILLFVLLLVIMFYSINVIFNGPARTIYYYTWCTTGLIKIQCKYYFICEYVVDWLYNRYKNYLVHYFVHSRLNDIRTFLIKRVINLKNKIKWDKRWNLNGFNVWLTISVFKGDKSVSKNYYSYFIQLIKYATIMFNNNCTHK